MSQRPDTPDAADICRARLTALAEHAPLAFAVVHNEQFQYVSAHMDQLFGCTDETGLAGHGTRGILAIETAGDGVHERIAEAAVAHRPFVEEVACLRRDGGRFWGRLQAMPVQWSEPKGEMLWWVQDVTADVERRNAPTWTSAHDLLTELANRREFERRVGDHAGSHRREAVSVLWLDVDRFADVNDKLGNDAGDQLLTALSRVFVARLRSNDLVARLDADRFGMLLPSCDSAYAQSVAEKLRGAVAAYRLRWATKSLRVRASVGVVQITPELDTVGAVMTAAHDACLDAKRAGGDCVRLWAGPKPPQAQAA